MESYIKQTSDIKEKFNKDANFIQASAEFTIDYTGTPIEGIVSYIVVNHFEESDWEHIGTLNKKHIRSVPTKDNPAPVFKFVVPTIVFLNDTEYDKYDELMRKALLHTTLFRKALEIQKDINRKIKYKLEDMVQFINSVNVYATQKIDMINGEKFNEYVSYQ